MESLLENSGIMAVARIKRPHRLFKTGDLIVGERRDGCADNLVCWGWSSKKNRIIGGKWGYRIYYAGHVWDDKTKREISTGKGYLRIIEWFEDRSIKYKDPSEPRNLAWFKRLLLEVSHENSPLTITGIVPDSDQAV